MTDETSESLEKRVERIEDELGIEYPENLVVVAVDAGGTERWLELPVTVTENVDGRHHVRADSEDDGFYANEIRLEGTNE